MGTIESYNSKTASHGGRRVGARLPIGFSGGASAMRKLPFFYFLCSHCCCLRTCKYRDCLLWRTNMQRGIEREGYHEISAIWNRQHRRGDPGEKEIIMNRVMNGIVLAGALVLPPGPRWRRTNPTSSSSWGTTSAWFNIGAYHQGMMAGRTPNLDKLANEGMLFTDTTPRRAARRAARTSSPASCRSAPA